MTTRAALNILGSDGSLIDLTSLGVDQISTAHPETGSYEVCGTLGMAPPPHGWGYVVNRIDEDKSIALSFVGGLLTVSVSKDGRPVDLQHSITLHVSVEELPLTDTLETPTEPVDLLQAVREKHARLRAIADYEIAPLQDAVDVEEAVPDDLALLAQWKKYRIALSKVDDLPGFPNQIDWPQPPA